VLVIREKALGPEHAYTATALNNLAMLYHMQGRYTQISVRSSWQRAAIAG
jgi:hypothetical protein